MIENKLNKKYLSARYIELRKQSGLEKKVFHAQDFKVPNQYQLFGMTSELELRHLGHRRHDVDHKIDEEEEGQFDVERVIQSFVGHSGGGRQASSSGQQLNLTRKTDGKAVVSDVEQDSWVRTKKELQLLDAVQICIAKVS